LLARMKLTIGRAGARQSETPSNRQGEINDLK